MYWPIYHLREPINKAKTINLIATYCNILVQETISKNSHRQQRKPVEMFFSEWLKTSRDNKRRNKNITLCPSGSYTWNGVNKGHMTIGFKTKP
jgi:hypothetical protein